MTFSVAPIPETSGVTETATPGEHTPDTGQPTPSPQDAEPTTTALLKALVDYRARQWPVLAHHHQIRMSLQQRLVAVLIPTTLTAPIRDTLLSWNWTPAVLAHPYAPEQRVLLAEVNPELAWAWPAPAQRVTGSLLLPPSTTARGPVRWVHLPDPDLPLAREIDLLAALRTTTLDSAPTDQT